MYYPKIQTLCFLTHMAFTLVGVSPSLEIILSTVLVENSLPYLFCMMPSLTMLYVFTVILLVYTSECCYYNKVGHYIIQ